VIRQVSEQCGLARFAASEGFEVASEFIAGHSLPLRWQKPAAASVPKLAEARRVAVERNVANADHHAANVLPVIREIQRSGASLHQVADALNARGIGTPRGGRWYAKSVSNVLARSA
jgi:hypothetical protein